MYIIQKYDFLKLQLVEVEVKHPTTVVTSMHFYRSLKPCLALAKLKFFQRWENSIRLSTNVV
jgi:hypothetical protein